MFLAYNDTNEVRLSLHTLDLSGVPLKPVMWHAFLHR